MLRSWTLQAGYPLVTVERREGERLLLSQESNHAVMARQDDGNNNNNNNSGRAGKSVASSGSTARHDFWNSSYVDDDGDVENNLWHIPVHVAYLRNDSGANGNSIASRSIDASSSSSSSPVFVKAK